MLQAAANTAPTGVYVCGHTSTAAGLTVSQSCGCIKLHYICMYVCMYIILYSTDYCVLQVTVSRDSSSSDYSLDAGALVLADQGLQICIKCTHTYVRIHIRIIQCHSKVTSQLLESFVQQTLVIS